MFDRMQRLSLCMTIGVISMIGCSKQMMISKIDQMVFLGHIYQTGQEGKIDFRIENVHFDNFDMVFLGGDLCVETTKDRRTLIYLDSIFNLSDAKTHWSWGNHDIRNGNTDWIQQTTGKESFYYIDQNSIRIMVLNTNLDDCKEMSQQYEMLMEGLQVDETITHYLIISHHAVWTAYLEDRGIVSGANAKHSIWRAFCRSEKSTFVEAILPPLIELRKEGKEVIWAAGDFGQKVSGFAHRTNEGIWYLGNGLAENGRLSPDSIMIFNWDSEVSSLSWHFTGVEEFMMKYR